MAVVLKVIHVDGLPTDGQVANVEFHFDGCMQHATLLCNRLVPIWERHVLQAHVEILQWCDAHQRGRWAFADDIGKYEVDVRTLFWVCHLLGSAFERW